jgi:azurin
MPSLCFLACSSMADQHDTHQQGGGFWGCASTFMAISVGAFAAVAGAALIFGGMTRKPKGTEEAAPPPAAASPAAPTAAADLPVLEVTVKPASENALTFDTKEIRAKAGQKVKLTYLNEHALSPMQHNLLICKPGSKERIIEAANAMMTDLPKWLAKDLIPDSPDVLHHTKLMNPGEKFTLDFVAGAPGDYPYVCTFPGHTLLMQGTLKVE